MPILGRLLVPLPLRKLRELRKLGVAWQFPQFAQFPLCVSRIVFALRPTPAAEAVLQRLGRLSVDPELMIRTRHMLDLRGLG
jgi:hypothetical protein